MCLYRSSKSRCQISNCFRVFYFFCLTDCLLSLLFYRSNGDMGNGLLDRQKVRYFCFLKNRRKSFRDVRKNLVRFKFPRFVRMHALKERLTFKFAHI